MPEHPSIRLLLTLTDTGDRGDGYSLLVTPDGDEWAQKIINGTIPDICDRLCLDLKRLLPRMMHGADPPPGA